MDFLFSTDENGQLYINLNGANIPSVERLKEMQELIGEYIALGQQEIDSINARWDIEREEERQAMLLSAGLTIKPSLKRPEPGYLYLIQSKNLFKIGRCKSIENRFKSYTTENPHGVTLIAHAYVNNYTEAENELLAKYASKNYRGEWFELDQTDVEEIKMYFSEIQHHH